MKNFIHLIIIISLVFAVNSCDNDSNTHAFNVDCKQLEAGVINYDRDLVNTEITKLLKDLNPALTNSDPFGHSNNFEILINRINLCNEISAELLCYTCIKTYPPQSEIFIRTDSMGISITRIIDIKTPKDSKLEFANIHQAYSGGSLKLQNTNYLGCFIDNSVGSLKSSIIETDTIYYSIANDTLTLNIIKNYNCCGLLKDSIVFENENVNIYISDTCKENCLCRCNCNFGFEYKFTDFWERNTQFNVYLKGLNENVYQFWKGTKFII